MSTDHGNLLAREGVDRCGCGAKYWEHDRCVSCDAPFPGFRGTRTRPNANPILDMMRDDDFDDPWGTAVGWAGSAADVLYDADPNMVPPSLGYRPGMGGPEVPNGSDKVDPYRITLEDVGPHQTVMIWCWLHDVSPDDPIASDADALPYWSDPRFAARAAELRNALVCLSRYLDWCKAAGRDY